MAANSLKLNVAPDVQAAFDAIHLEIATHKDTIVRLQAELGKFPDRLKAACASNEFIDKTRAEAVRIRCIALLTICAEHPQKDWVPYALAAIDYFVREDDAQPDFASPFDGFDDDEQVLNSVIDHFDLKKLLKSKLGDAA